ncbi:MAG: hypothetical protein ABR614_02565 [Mycobacteriales bacterium]
MSVQMTIRVDDDLAVFVDQATHAGEGSRAEVINRALRRELRRRAAARDAHIYASTSDSDLDSDAYAAWAAQAAAASIAELG